MPVARQEWQPRSWPMPAAARPARAVGRPPPSLSRTANRSPVSATSLNFRHLVNGSLSFVEQSEQLHPVVAKRLRDVGRHAGARPPNAQAVAVRRRDRRSREAGASCRLRGPQGLRVSLGQRRAARRGDRPPSVQLAASDLRSRLASRAAAARRAPPERGAASEPRCSGPPACRAGARSSQRPWLPRSRTGWARSRRLPCARRRRHPACPPGG
jgi:hypothetical protein